MAYIKKTESNAATKSTKATASTKEAVKEVKEPVKKEKVFQPTDAIPCRSVTSGPLYLTGTRSGIPYTWADYNDIQDVEYRDLIYLARTSGNKYIYNPRFIIEDEDFVNQNPKVKELYDSIFNTNDLRDIVKLPVKSMVAEINRLPEGARNSFKGIVTTMIYNHEIDSVQKIKAIDEIFGTKILLMLAQE
jgi:hypothetical protein